MQEESRRARSVRRAHRRRRIIAGGVFAIMVLSAAGYVVHASTTGDNPTADGTEAGGSNFNSTTRGDTPALTVPDTSPAGSAGPTTTNEAAAFSGAIDSPPQELTITGNPEFIKLKITLQDGTVLTGKTPFAEQVPGGNIHVEFTKAGYNTTSRDLTLDGPTTLKVWLDLEGQLYESLVRFKCGANPKQVAFTPDGEELWVSLLGGYGLEVYEPTTGVRLGGVKLGEHGAVEVVFTRDGRTVYASQMETAAVYEIDRATRAIKRKFDTGGDWTKVVLLSPDEKTLWASNWVSNNVSEIDLATGKAATLLRTGGAMRHMVDDAARGLLYVDDMSTDEVYVVDLDTDKASKLADTDRRPNTMDLSPDGLVLYVSNRGKDNPKTYYLPGPEWGTVLALDTATGRILDAIVGRNQCTGLDVSPDGSLLAFSNFLDNHIEVFRIPSYETLLAGGGGRAEQRFEDRIKDQHVLR